MKKEKNCKNFYVIVDHNLVEKTAPREYSEFMMNLKKYDMTLEDIAMILTNTPQEEFLWALPSKALFEELKLPVQLFLSYDKFRRKAEKRLKVKNLRLVVAHSKLAHEKKHSACDVFRKKDYDILNLEDPIWVVDLEISPLLKKVKASPVVLE